MSLEAIFLLFYGVGQNPKFGMLSQKLLLKPGKCIVMTFILFSLLSVIPKKEINPTSTEGRFSLLVYECLNDYDFLKG